jgi:1-acyl-sn-glycerol-3-phosphate acyltransferase
MPIIRVLSATAEDVFTFERRATMRYRIFTTPLITSVAFLFSKTLLAVTGWKVVGEIPAHVKKCVVIGAPHTSNWDFPIFLMTAFVLRLNAHWMGKHTLFRFPFHSLMTWLGGIPIRRDIRGDMVAKATEMFRTSDELVIGLSPEGTRKAAERWHTGFWHIAQRARVPIYLAFIDYGTKHCGLYGPLHSLGNVENDMKWIKNFYSHFQGRHPHNFKI